jgi:hypothetical protein
LEEIGCQKERMLTIADGGKYMGRQFLSPVLGLDSRHGKAHKVCGFVPVESNARKYLLFFWGAKLTNPPSFPMGNQIGQSGYPNPEQ